MKNPFAHVNPVFAASAALLLGFAFRGVYYRLKPVIPWRVRLLLRRRLARLQRERNQESWPISEAAGKRPEGWPGWPGQKMFSFVLTHDVESERGLLRVRELAQLEMSLGFRSAFNFIPDGPYRVPDELRCWLVENGFEVGVHDYRHDGTLFRSRRRFAEGAARINQCLSEWGAVGFRSGFMLRNMEWLHDLNIVYDASTFDTDPFEPQPDGCDTIFPFRVRGAGGRGYIELPYTLVQDSTLFLILQEPGNSLWKRKLEWVRAHGGMALLNVHPDYIQFAPGTPGPQQYPVEFYRDFLVWLKDRFAGDYHHALPREIAAYISSAASGVASGVAPAGLFLSPKCGPARPAGCEAGLGESKVS